MNQTLKQKITNETKKKKLINDFLAGLEQTN